MLESSKIELSATKVKGFQCKAIATKSPTLDISGVLNPPLIKIFGKVSFNLTQETVISFSLMEIYGCCRHSGSASDSSAWIKTILIWRKQPFNLIQQPFM